jgi:hypothetical protein
VAARLLARDPSEKAREHHAGDRLAGFGDRARERRVEPFVQEALREQVAEDVPDRGALAVPGRSAIPVEQRACDPLRRAGGQREPVEQRADLATRPLRDLLALEREHGAHVEPRASGERAAHALLAGRLAPQPGDGVLRSGASGPRGRDEPREVGTRHARQLVERHAAAPVVEAGAPGHRQQAGVDRADREQTRDLRAEVAVAVRPQERRGRCGEAAQRLPKLVEAVRALHAEQRLDPALRRVPGPGEREVSRRAGLGQRGPEQRTVTRARDDEDLVFRAAHVHPLLAPLRRDPAARALVAPGVAGVELLLVEVRHASV